jgi:hypothetical protein
MKMKPSDYRSAKSFAGKTRAVLALLGIIPFLLVVFLFTYKKIEFRISSFYSRAWRFFSILAGFYLMRSSADHWVAWPKKPASWKRPKTMRCCGSNPTRNCRIFRAL